MATRQSFDQELEKVRRELLDMGQLVEAAIGDAIRALKEKDVELAQKVMDGDDEIDRMEVEIDDKCMVLIARQQPMARDLRIVSTGLKITTDIERIGDHAFDIAKIAARIANQPLIKPLIDIPLMGQMAQKMLQDALDAYLTLDITKADQVCQDDDKVDQLYQQMFRELLTYMMEDPRTISQATELIFVARYLERIADHTTNIAEWVIYLVTGERLRKN